MQKMPSKHWKPNLSKNMKLSKEESKPKKCENITPEDIEETLKLVKEIPEIVSVGSEILRNLMKKIHDGELNTEKGLSFLDLKNLNLLHYITNLAYIVLKKLHGKKIENDPAIKRLAELRVVMEKMRSVEEKLKYQINKLLSNASSEKIGSKDPLKFRANPDSLDTEDEDGDDASVKDGKESKVYVPPKISAHYFEDDLMKNRKEQAEKYTLNRYILNELQQEYSEAPEEVKEMCDPIRQRITKELNERQRFEEEYMMRLPMTKQQRHEMRQVSTVFNTNFDEFEMTPSNVELSKKKLSIKKGKKYKGKSKGMKRKHKK